MPAAPDAESVPGEIFMNTNYLGENSKIFFQMYQTVLGTIRISATYDAVVGLNFRSDCGTVVNLQSIHSDNFINQETVLLKETFHQLSEYLEGKRKNFNLPTAPRGTDFQKKVWNES